MSGFVKLEGCVEFPNQFHIGWYVTNEKAFPTDDIDLFQDTSFERGIMNKLTWYNQKLADFFISLFFQVVLKD